MDTQAWPGPTTPTCDLTTGNSCGKETKYDWGTAHTPNCGIGAYDSVDDAIDELLVSEGLIVTGFWSCPTLKTYAYATSGFVNGVNCQ